MSTGDEIESGLEAAARDRREAQAVRTRLAAAAEFAQQAGERVQQARATLTVETRDVDKLENLSWSKIVSSVRGSHAGDLERERAQRQAAAYALATIEARESAARRDVAGLEQQLAALGDVDRRYADALSAKEDWARSNDGTVAAALSEIAERRGVLLAEDREAREAHQAGSEAHELLAHAQQLLGSAGSWATWDTFGGGGMFSDMMKYDKLDRVSRTLHQADAAITRFSAELADLHVDAVRGVRMDGMTRTFDVFFDNIFSDMAVRSRIREADERVRRALHGVRSALDDLSRRGGAIADELAELESRREQQLLG